MTDMPSSTALKTYADEHSRWAAVMARESAADRAFVYGVRTTKIYCRPICKARLARRANVVFFKYASEARDAGFRACKRCKPEVADSMPEEAAERKVSEFLERLPTGEGQLATVGSMAKNVGLSKWHFHRVFKKVTGSTPREYFKTVLEHSSSQNTETTGTPTSGSSPSYDDTAYRDFLFNDEYPASDYSLLSIWETPDFSIQFSSTEPSAFDYDPNMILDAGASSNKTPVHFSIITVSQSFGSLLIAFQNREIAAIIQGSTQAELKYSLEQKFPSAVFDHCPLSEDAQDPINSALQFHVGSIATAMRIGT